MIDDEPLVEVSVELNQNQLKRLSRIMHKEQIDELIADIEAVIMKFGDDLLDVQKKHDSISQDLTSQKVVPLFRVGSP